MDVKNLAGRRVRQKNDAGRVYQESLIFEYTNIRIYGNWYILIFEYTNIRILVYSIVVI